MFKNILLIFYTLIITILILLHFEFNTDYVAINRNVPMITQKGQGTLYIVTHNYEHKDILITMKQFSKYNQHFYMLFADKSWNHWLEPFRPNNIEFMYVKENTVSKISSKLLLGHNVIMFLYHESESTGPYYILQNTKCPLVIIKINKNNENKNNETNGDTLIKNHYNSSFQEIYWNNFLAKFTIEIKHINYDLSINSKIFIENLKEEMYL